MDKAARELDLRWLFRTPSTAPIHQAPVWDLSPQKLATTPYAHLVLSLLLCGPSKAVRTLALSLLKSLWLLESVKALHAKPAASAPAQHPQRAMLTLLLQWVPSLAAYPESVQPYFQLLTWILTTTPTLPEHLRIDPGSLKKKMGGKPSAKGNTAQLKPRASGGSSGSLAIWHRAEGLFQDVLTASVVSQTLGALQQFNGVLANHMHGATFQSLQVSQLCLSRRGVIEFFGFPLSECRAQYL